MEIQHLRIWQDSTNLHLRLDKIHNWKHYDNFWFHPPAWRFCCLQGLTTFWQSSCALSQPLEKSVPWNLTNQQTYAQICSVSKNLCNTLSEMESLSGRFGTLFIPRRNDPMSILQTLFFQTNGGSISHAMRLLDKWRQKYGVFSLMLVRELGTSSEASLCNFTGCI